MKQIKYYGRRYAPLILCLNTSLSVKSNLAKAKPKNNILYMGRCMFVLMLYS